MAGSPSARLGSHHVYVVDARIGAERFSHGPGRLGAVKRRPLVFSYENPFCTGLLYGRAGRLTAKKRRFPAPRAATCLAHYLFAITKGY